MTDLYQSGQCIEGAATNGMARKAQSQQRPELVSGRPFLRCVLERNAKLEISTQLECEACLQDGSHRAVGDSVNGTKIKVLSERPLRCDAKNPHTTTGTHQAQPVSARCHTIASVVMRYTAVPETHIEAGGGLAIG